MFGLIILSPFLLIISIWIKLDSKGSVFFKQSRVGQHGELFTIHKFRTMKADSEFSSQLTVGNDSRITYAGFFLRKYKIDELPQLFDVLIGKMSIVGPRPEVQEFIDLYPKNIRQKVLSVRPGITDYASIEMVDENKILGQHKDARGAYVDIILPLKQKYYVEYVECQTFWRDLKIIFLTIKKIILR